MMRPVLILCAAGLVLAGAVGAVAVTNGADAATTEESTTRPLIDTERAAVTRGDLVETHDANGQLGYGTVHTLAITAQGVVTAAPEVGDVLDPGDAAVEIDKRPVTLVAGDTPLYRELRRVRGWERDAAGDKLGEQNGDDVRQLQDHLLANGFDDEGRLDADGTFGVSTERAVKDWQRSVGHPATGKVDGTQILFLDGPVRVDSAPDRGSAFDQMRVTSTDPTVTVTIDRRVRSFYPEGSTVELESVNGRSTGTVVKVERTVGGDGGTAYELDIRVDDAVALGDADSVKVIASDVKAADVLTLPVRSLLALAEGGWAVQIDVDGELVLRAVEIGEIVDGRVEVTGLAEGDEVVVPV